MCWYKRTVLTKPCLSEMLLVSFSLWNDTTFCIHCSPVDGESGWMYIRLGISGSAFPATIHRLDIQNTQNANGSRVIQSHSRPFKTLTSISFQELQNKRKELRVFAVNPISNETWPNEAPLLYWNTFTVQSTKYQSY